MSKTQRSQNLKKKSKQLKSKNWRLIIPKITKLGLHPWDSKMVDGLKSEVLRLLLEKESSRGLENYMIAVEKHLSGFAHLDILLLYSKRIANTMTRYDYIIKHGDLTRYSTVNKSILDYGRKDDPNPLANFTTSQLLLQKKASSKKSLYLLLKNELEKNPFKFNPIRWVKENNLGAHILHTSFERVFRLIGLEQKIVCRDVIRSKPGIQQITPELIRKTLTPTQYMQYKSWAGYDVIISHINQIVKWGWNRPHKTKNLLLVGDPNSGKTSLLISLEKHISSYQLGTVGGWFPEYSPKTYKLFSWDEFNLSSYKYPVLLKLLEGRPMKLPIKGGHVGRDENQLIIGTSNLSLERHVAARFKKQIDRETALKNLSVRIKQVVIPKNKTLFLLLSLIKKLK